MSEALEATAKLYDEAARELDQAARHCEVAAQHFRDNLVPRGTAHTWAAHGHMLEGGGAAGRAGPRARPPLGPRGLIQPS
jgi:hypothetical protein